MQRSLVAGHLVVASLSLAASLAACAADPAATGGPRVAIAVAPLRLPGIVDACFTLTVTNGPGGSGDVVWSQADLCSTQYGDSAGALSYVGPCDADVATKNTVILELTSVEDEDGPAAFVNPCGAPDNAPCQLEVTCVENADAPVAFDLTIMRPASQGFFDVAVNFEDIFCSAKVDCQYGPGQPITLLADPDTGVRGQTSVFAFACTAGAGADADTVLHMGNVRVVCADPSTPNTFRTTVLDPTIPPGNAYDAAHPDPDHQDTVWQYASYRGAESLTCGVDAQGAAIPCNKLYWNMAIGFDPTTPYCTILAEATASSGGLIDDTTPAHTTYPFVTVSVPLTDANGLVCTANPLLGDGSGVQVDYTATDAPLTFCHAYDGADATTSPSCSGTGTNELLAAACGRIPAGEQGCECHKHCDTQSMECWMVCRIIGIDLQAPAWTE